jgi:copper(I)-binding protein
MRRLTLAVLLALLVTACAEVKAPLTASNVIVTQAMPGTTMSAGYFVLTNNSEQAISITHVTSPEFASVEMHETVIKDEVARMISLGTLTVPAGETVTFERGGKHLMLMRAADDIDSVTLHFYAGESLLLSVNTAFGG